MTSYPLTRGYVFRLLQILAISATIHSRRLDMPYFARGDEHWGPRHPVARYVIGENLARNIYIS